MAGDRLRLRLKSTSDFERVRREGRSHAHPLVVLVACATGGAGTRWGFTAGRTVGTAVQRNRAKRLLREAVRTLAPAAAPGWDLMLIARAPLAKQGLKEARAAVQELLERANVLEKND